MDKKWFTTNRMTLTFLLLGMVIFLFIVVPLIKMIVASDPKVLLETLFEPEVRSAIWLSLYAAFIATVVGLFLGVPLAYLLARVEFPGKNLVEGLIDVPIVVPHTAAGIALLFVFGRNFFAGKVFFSVFVPKDAHINMIHAQYVFEIFFGCIRNNLIHILHCFQLCVAFNYSLYWTIFFWAVSTGISLQSTNKIVTLFSSIA